MRVISYAMGHRYELDSVNVRRKASVILTDDVELQTRKGTAISSLCPIDESIV
jgi:hypothetical protein